MNTPPGPHSGPHSGPQSSPQDGSRVPLEVGGLAGLRRHAGLTQEEVAAKIGITQQTVQRMETSWPNVQMRTYLAYVAACGGTGRVLAQLRAGTVEIKIN